MFSSGKRRLRRFEHLVGAKGAVAVCALILVGCATASVDGPSEENPYTADLAQRDIDHLERLMAEHGPPRASTPFVLGGLRAMLEGDYERANGQLQRALKFDPRNSFLHTLNALAHQLRGEAGDPEQFELAEVGYELAASMDPGFSEVPYFLGVLKFRQQRFHEAREQFARAVMLKPDQPEYLIGLAATSYYLGELDIAYAVAQNAMTVAPAHPGVLRTSGLIYAAVGDFDAAEQSKNALGSLSRTRERYVGQRIGDWQRYYTASALQQDPVITQYLAQNLDPFGVPQGGMFDPEGGDNQDPMSRSADDSGPVTDDATTDTTAAPVPAPAPSAAPADPAGRAAPTGGDATAAGEGAAPRAAPARPRIKTPQMALIDVAIIRTEEIYKSGKGVNLLDGLNIFFSGNQFLQFKTPAVGHIRTPQTANDVITLQLGTNGAGLTYSLNIFNDNYDRNEVIARPTILVEDQKKSSFFSGGTLHIVIEGGIAGSGAVEPINTGVQLEVTPKFLDTETIDLNVFAQRTFLESSLSQVSDTITGTSFASTSKTTISANLTLRYGETMVLSGLSDQEKEKLDDKTPGLGDLPVIQYLFRRQTETSAKKTVLILLTPRLATLDYNAQGEPLPDAESTDDTNVGKLRKSTSWMRPEPHLAAFVRHLSKYEYFNHFRRGDMQLENWADEGTVLDALERTLDYLYIYYDFEKADEPPL